MLSTKPLPISSTHFQRIKLIMIKLLFTKYKSKLIRVTMVTIHIQLTVSMVLWIIITINLMRILLKMSSAILYRHNKLKSLSWIDFFCVFIIGLRSLIHNTSAIKIERQILSNDISDFPFTSFWCLMRFFFRICPLVQLILQIIHLHLKYHLL